MTYTEPQEPDPTRTVALALAILNHGLANLAPDVRPARIETVMDTADKFVDYLNGEPSFEALRRGASTT